MSGFPPPPGGSFLPPPPVPSFIHPPPSLHINPPAPEGFIQPIHAAAPASTPPTPHVLGSIPLYVTDIPTSMSSRTLEALFRLCGEVRRVLRVRDLTDQPMPYAFIEILGFEAAARAIRNVNNLTLPDSTSTLRVTIDAHRVKALREYEQIHNSPEDAAADGIVLGKIYALLKDPLEDPPVDANGADGMLNDLPETMDEEQRAYISREIAEFRQRAAARDKTDEEVRARRTAATRAANRRDEDFLRGDAAATSHADGRDRSRPHTRNPSVDVDPLLSDRRPTKPGSHTPGSAEVQGINPCDIDENIIDDPAFGGAPDQGEGEGEAQGDWAYEEAYRQSRVEDARCQQNEEHLRLRARREEERIARVRREARARDERISGADQARDRLSRTLQEWDDEAEEARGTELYFHDRKTWRLERQHRRTREADADAELLLRAADHGPGGGLNLAAPLDRGISPGMVTSSAPSHAQGRAIGERSSYVGEYRSSDRHPTAQRSHTSTLSSPPPPPPPATSLSAEEKQMRVKALIDEIPIEADALWAFPVRWETLGESGVRDVLGPWIAGRVADLLDAPDAAMTRFILDHLLDQKPAPMLVRELQRALDDEGEKLVKLLWRKLIFETEARARNLV